MEAAVSQGMHDLPISFIQQFGRFIGCDDGDYSTLLQGLISVSRFVFPAIKQDDLNAILENRKWEEEVFDDVEDIIGLEWILDSFNEHEKKDLQHHIDTAKRHKLEGSLFTEEYRHYKVCVFVSGCSKEGYIQRYGNTVWVK